MNDDPLIGRTIGSYTVERRLGKGAMGAVYFGTHNMLGTNAALKVLIPHLATNDQYKKRFLREAKAAFQLKHPNVVSVLDCGNTDDGILYLAMDFIEGETLSALLRRGPLSIDRALPLFHQMLDALIFAHHKGFIHRDVKPDNVLISTEANAFLADFGLARDSASQSALTADGQVLGTPAFMPLEQWEGETVDARADQYALGVVFYYALSGQLPVMGKTPTEFLTKLTSGKRITLAQRGLAVPDALCEIVDKMTSIDKDNRYANLADAKAAIIFSGVDVSAGVPVGAGVGAAGYAGATGSAGASAARTPSGPIATSGAGTRPAFGSKAGNGLKTPPPKPNMGNPGNRASRPTSSGAIPTTGGKPISSSRHSRVAGAGTRRALGDRPTSAASHPMPGGGGSVAGAGSRGRSRGGAPVPASDGPNKALLLMVVVAALVVVGLAVAVIMVVSQPSNATGNNGTANANESEPIGANGNGSATNNAGHNTIGANNGTAGNGSGSNTNVNSVTNRQQWREALSNLKDEFDDVGDAPDLRKALENVFLDALVLKTKADSAGVSGEDLSSLNLFIEDIVFPLTYVLWDPIRDEANSLADKFEFASAKRVLLDAQDGSSRLVPAFARDKALFSDLYSQIGQWLDRTTQRETAFNALNDDTRRFARGLPQLRDARDAAMQANARGVYEPDRVRAFVETLSRALSTLPNATPRNIEDATRFNKDAADLVDWYGNHVAGTLAIAPGVGTDDAATEPVVREIEWLTACAAFRTYATSGTRQNLQRALLQIGGNRGALAPIETAVAAAVANSDFDGAVCAVQRMQLLVLLGRVPVGDRDVARLLAETEKAAWAAIERAKTGPDREDHIGMCNMYLGLYDAREFAEHTRIAREVVDQGDANRVPSHAEIIALLTRALRHMRPTNQEAVPDTIAWGWEWLNQMFQWGFGFYNRDPQANEPLSDILNDCLSRLFSECVFDHASVVASGDPAQARVALARYDQIGRFLNIEQQPDVVEQHNQRRADLEEISQR